MAFQDLLWANPEIKLSLGPSAGPSLDIPESRGRVEEVHLAPAGSKTLYLLQDAHTNESAQRNIAWVLDLLTEKKKVRYVFLEAGTGDDSLSDLRPLADAKKRLRTADRYLRKAWLQGPDYLDLTSERDFRLWGVEDKALYFEGVDLYRAIAKKREAADAYLDKFHRAAEFLKTRQFNPDLLEFDRERQAFSKNGLFLSEYFGTLSSEAREENISLLGYPNILSLQDVREKESKVDFKKANEEQQRLFRSLPGEESRSLAKADPANARLLCDFYASLAEKVADLSLYPEFSRYLDYLKAVRKLDSSALLEEIGSLENEIAVAKTLTTEEKTLLGISSRERILRRIVNLSAMSADLRAIAADPAPFEAREMAGHLNRQIMEFRTRYEDAIFLNEDFERVFREALTFYALTEKRDRAFVQNIVQKMEAEKQSRAAFVTGGFHADYLKRLLREQNISYVSVLPGVSQETNIKKYETLLLSQPRLAPAVPLMAVKPSANLWNTLPAAELVVSGRSMTAILKDELAPPAGARHRALSDSSPAPAKAQGARLAKNDIWVRGIVGVSGVALLITLASLLYLNRDEPDIQLPPIQVSAPDDSLASMPPDTAVPAPAGLLPLPTDTLRAQYAGLLEIAERWLEAGDSEQAALARLKYLLLKGAAEDWPAILDLHGPGSNAYRDMAVTLQDFLDNIALLAPLSPDVLGPIADFIGQLRAEAGRTVSAEIPVVDRLLDLSGIIDVRPPQGARLADSDFETALDTNVIFFDYGQVLGTQIEDYFDETVDQLLADAGFPKNMPAAQKDKISQGLRVLLIPPSEAKDATDEQRALLPEGVVLLGRHELHRFPILFARWVGNVNRFLKYHGASKAIKEHKFATAFYTPLQANPDIQNQLSRLKEIKKTLGIRFGILSNFEGEGREWLTELVSREYPGLFDDVLILTSGNERRVKGDGPEVFRTALEKFKSKFGHDPKNPVFIDNQLPRYVENARAAGFKTLIHYGFAGAQEEARRSPLFGAKRYGETDSAGYFSTLYDNAKPPLVLERTFDVALRPWVKSSWWERGQVAQVVGYFSKDKPGRVGFEKDWWALVRFPEGNDSEVPASTLTPLDTLEGLAHRLTSRREKEVSVEQLQELGLLAYTLAGKTALYNAEDKELARLAQKLHLPPVGVQSIKATAPARVVKVFLDDPTKPSIGQYVGLKDGSIAKVTGFKQLSSSNLQGEGVILDNGRTFVSSSLLPVARPDQLAKLLEVPVESVNIFHENGITDKGRKLFIAAEKDLERMKVILKNFAGIKFPDPDRRAGYGKTEGSLMTRIERVYFQTLTDEIRRVSAPEAFTSQEAQNLAMAMTRMKAGSLELYTYVYWDMEDTERIAQYRLPDLYAFVKKVREEREKSGKMPVLVARSPQVQRPPDKHAAEKLQAWTDMNLAVRAKAIITIFKVDVEIAVFTSEGALVGAVDPSKAKRLDPAGEPVIMPLSKLTDIRVQGMDDEWVGLLTEGWGFAGRFPGLSHFKALFKNTAQDIQNGQWPAASRKIAQLVLFLWDTTSNTVQLRENLDRLLHRIVTEHPSVKSEMLGEFYRNDSDVRSGARLAEEYKLVDGITVIKIIRVFEKGRGPYKGKAEVYATVERVGGSGAQFDLNLTNLQRNLESLSDLDKLAAGIPMDVKKLKEHVLAGDIVPVIIMKREDKSLVVTEENIKNALFLDTETTRAGIRKMLGPDAPAGSRLAGPGFEASRDQHGPVLAFGNGRWKLGVSDVNALVSGLNSWAANKILPESLRFKKVNPGIAHFHFKVFDGAKEKGVIAAVNLAHLASELNEVLFSTDAHAQLQKFLLEKAILRESLSGLARLAYDLLLTAGPAQTPRVDSVRRTFLLLEAQGIEWQKLQSDEMKKLFLLLLDYAAYNGEAPVRISRALSVFRTERGGWASQSRNSAKEQYLRSILLSLSEPADMDQSKAYLIFGARLATQRPSNENALWVNPEFGEPVFTREEFLEARAVLDGVIVETPLFEMKGLSATTGKLVLYKDEAKQVSGSFKMRGVYFQVYSAIKDLIKGAGSRNLLYDRVKIVTQSTGNHGIAMIRSVTHAIIRLSQEYPAFEFLLRRIEPLVFSYQALSPAKRHGMNEGFKEFVQTIPTAFGMRTMYGLLRAQYADYDEAKKARQAFMDQNGPAALYMDHGGQRIMLGHGTAGIEIAEQLRQMGVPDNKKVVLLLPVGEGGPIGAGAALKIFRPNVSVVMVQARGIDAFVRTMQTGVLQKNTERLRKKFLKVFDGIAVDGPDPRAVQPAKAYLDAGVIVDGDFALIVASPILHSDLMGHYKDAGQVRVGGTTALVAEALLSFQDRLRAIREADIVILLGMEGNAESFLDSEAWLSGILSRVSGALDFIQRFFTAGPNQGSQAPEREEERELADGTREYYQGPAFVRASIPYFKDWPIDITRHREGNPRSGHYSAEIWVGRERLDKPYTKPYTEEDRTGLKWREIQAFHRRPSTLELEDIYLVDDARGYGVARAIILWLSQRALSRGMRLRVNFTRSSAVANLLLEVLDTDRMGIRAITPKGSGDLTPRQLRDLLDKFPDELPYSVTITGHPRPVASQGARLSFDAAASSGLAYDVYKERGEGVTVRVLLRQKIPDFETILGIYYQTPDERQRTAIRRLIEEWAGSRSRDAVGLREVVRASRTIRRHAKISPNEVVFSSMFIEEISRRRDELARAKEGRGFRNREAEETNRRTLPERIAARRARLEEAKTLSGAAAKPASNGATGTIGTEKLSRRPTSAELRAIQYALASQLDALPSAELALAVFEAMAETGNREERQTRLAAALGLPNISPKLSARLHKLFHQVLTGEVKHKFMKVLRDRLGDSPLYAKLENWMEEMNVQIVTGQPLVHFDPVTEHQSYNILTRLSYATKGAQVKSIVGATIFVNVALTEENYLTLVAEAVKADVIGRLLETAEEEVRFFEQLEALYQDGFVHRLTALALAHFAADLRTTENESRRLKADAYAVMKVYFEGPDRAQALERTLHILERHPELAREWRVYVSALNAEFVATIARLRDARRGADRYGLKFGDRDARAALDAFFERFSLRVRENQDLPEEAILKTTGARLARERQKAGPFILVQGGLQQPQLRAEENGVFRLSQDILEILQSLTEIHVQGDAESKALNGQKKKLLADLRAVTRRVRVDVFPRRVRNYAKYREARVELNQRREQIYKAMREARRANDAPELIRLNLEAIRTNRMLLKVQLISAGLILTGATNLPRPALVRNAAYRTLLGAWHTSNLLLSEIRFRNLRLNASARRRTEEARSQEIGQMLVYRSGGLEIRVPKESPEGGIPVKIREMRWRSAHTPVKAALKHLSRGRAEEALAQVDLLRELYEWRYRGGRTERVITLDAEMLSEKIAWIRSRLQAALRERSLEAVYEAEEQLEALLTAIKQPKLKSQVLVPYRDKETAMRAQIHKLDTVLDATSGVENRQRLIESYIRLFEVAARLQKMDAKLVLARRELVIATGDLQEIQDWAEAGNVTQKQQTARLIRRALTALSAGNFYLAYDSLRPLPGLFEQRIEELDGHAADAEKKLLALYETSGSRLSASQFRHLLQFTSSKTKVFVAQRLESRAKHGNFDASSAVSRINRELSRLRSLSRDELRSEAFRQTDRQDDPHLSDQGRGYLERVTHALLERERALDRAGEPYVGVVGLTESQQKVAVDILGERFANALIDYRYAPKQQLRALPKGPVRMPESEEELYFLSRYETRRDMRPAFEDFLVQKRVPRGSAASIRWWYRFYRLVHASDENSDLSRALLMLERLFDLQLIQRALHSVHVSKIQTPKLFAMLQSASQRSKGLVEMVDGDKRALIRAIAADFNVSEQDLLKAALPREFRSGARLAADPSVITTLKEVYDQPDIRGAGSDAVSETILRIPARANRLNRSEWALVSRLRRAAASSLKGFPRREKKELHNSYGVYKPVSLGRVLRGLKGAGVLPGDTLLDLGHGQGLFVHAAAAVLGVKAAGAEGDPYLFRRSRAVHEALLREPDLSAERVELNEGSFMDLSWEKYDFVYYYSFGSFSHESIARKAVEEMRAGSKFLVLAERDRTVADDNFYDGNVVRRLLDSGAFRLTRYPADGLWVFEKTGARLVEDVTAAPLFGAQLQEFFVRTVNAQPVVSGSRMSLKDEGVTHLYTFLRHGRSYSVLEETGGSRRLIRDPKIEKPSPDALERLDRRALEQAEAALKGLPETDAKKILVYDVDTLQALPDDLFYAAIGGLLKNFRSKYAGRNVYLNLISRTEKTHRVQLALNHPISVSLPENVMGTLTPDLFEYARSHKQRVVNLLGVDKHTRPVVGLGMLLPVKMVEGGDLPILEPVLAVAVALAEADIDNQGQMERIRSAWQALAGIQIQMRTLKAILGNKASPEVILRYAFLPLVNVEALVLREYLTQQAVGIAA